MKRLCALLLFAFALPGCFDTDTLDPMERQPKYKAFSANPFFEDGRAMRPPPANTVPRERNLAAPSQTGGFGPDGKELTSIPVPLTRELFTRGHQRYDIYCATCHGLLGDGDSPVGRNFSLKPPPSLHEKRSQTVGHTFQVIAQGYGLMGSYANELPVPDRWAVVAYVRALQASQAGRIQDAPGDVRVKLEAAP